MSAPFQFHYRHTGIKTFEDLAELQTRFAGFLDPVFRIDLFKAIQVQMATIPDERQVEYTFEITIGDADPANDVVSLVGEILDKVALSFQIGIPKYIDQVSMKSHERLRHMGVNYSPMEKDAHWLYLLKAIGYYHPSIRTDAEVSHQTWHPTYLGFFEEVEKAYPTIHHVLYDLIHGRDPNVRQKFVPIFDIRRWYAHPALKYVLKAVAELYFKHRKKDIFGVEDLSRSAISSAPADHLNFDRLRQLLEPSYPLPGETWWKAVFGEDDSPLMAGYIDFGEDLIERHQELMLDRVFDQLKGNYRYRDITDLIAPPEKKDEVKVLAEEPTV